MSEDFNSCPIGVRNEQEILHTQEKFSLMIEQLTEKVDDIKNDVQVGFSNVNDKLEKLDQKVAKLEESLPDKIDDRVLQNNKNNIYNLIKWVVVTIGGSVLIGYLINLITK